jgi:ABC-type sugar transport system substrate-binding protein
MLIASGVEKILVCAPSNAAIDEVVTRLHNRGMVGVDL